MREKILFLSLLCCLFYLGCSGRTPNPVAAYQPGDSALSCEELRVEMAKCKQEIAIKPSKITEREARNTWLLFGWPIGSPFEMDITKAEETEIQALNNRYNSLFMIAVQKRCALGISAMTIKAPGGREPTANDILQDDQKNMPVSLQLGIQDQ